MQSHGIYKEVHYYEIDVFKGIAILLIIFGHCFCSYPVDFSTTYLRYFQELILSFHLNIFFVASGLLFSVGQDWRTFLKKKSRRLLLPWIFFSILSMLLRKVFSSFTHGHIDNFFETLLMNVICGNYFWFLYALFVMMAIAKVIRKKRIMISVSILLLFLQMYMFTFNIIIKPNILCVSRIIQFFPWFIIGFVLKESYNSIREFVKNNKFVSIIFTFTSVVLMSLLIYCSGDLVGSFVKYVALPFLGVISVYIISVLVVVCNFLDKMFIFFGKYSLQYYLNHLLIMLGCYYVGAFFFTFSPTASLLIIFVIALLISSLMLWAERKMPAPLRNVFGFI